MLVSCKPGHNLKQNKNESYIPKKKTKSKQNQNSRAAVNMLRTWDYRLSNVVNKIGLLCTSKIYRGYLVFSVSDRNLFHREDTIGNIFTSGAATSENITDGVHEKKILFISCF